MSMGSRALPTSTTRIRHKAAPRFIRPQAGKSAAQSPMEKARAHRQLGLVCVCGEGGGAEKELAHVN
ncbi:hypothetical protein BaRGS_00025637 [Batillaria attramentaria]|uniref:Uncharacterized protein n=1 Tax=Batillaria attramentaria TaxID=370345 RepID=A0ABD0K732_9CAEN